MTKPTDNYIEMARTIADAHGSHLAGTTELREHVARLVADGIAFGRCEGLKQAARMIEGDLTAALGRVRAAASSSSGNRQR